MFETHFLKPNTIGTKRSIYNIYRNPENNSIKQFLGYNTALDQNGVTFMYPYSCITATSKISRQKNAQVVQSLQSIVSRETDPLGAAVISVTKLACGDAYNVFLGSYLDW